MHRRDLSGVDSTSRFTSERTRHFTESVIREMTRKALQHGAINLAQGFPDFSVPEAIKTAAVQAILDDYNQYAITWGSKSLREAISAKYKRWYNLEVDPETEITVCCGSTECMIATLLAVVNPGEEIIVFEPFYENYGPDGHLCGAKVRYLTLEPPDWKVDFDELENLAASNVKAIILNTPHNPTGKVWTLDELERLAQLAARYDFLVISDEIYEHIVYDDNMHIPIWAVPGLRERSVMINSISKTYSVTGWRVGWAIAKRGITEAIRKVHDFLTVGAAAPLQEAAAKALRLPESYYEQLAEDYQAKRDYLVTELEKLGFLCYKPQGAYYVMADIRQITADDDMTFSDYLVREIGVAVVPGSSFYSGAGKGQHFVRFCFCKKWETLEEAVRRLQKLPRNAGASLD